VETAVKPPVIASASATTAITKKTRLRVWKKDVRRADSLEAERLKRRNIDSFPLEIMCVVFVERLT
jgi:hypothetical protein